MYRPKQFCAWHATSEMEFHPSQTGADHGAVLLSPGCTRFVQTVVCPLETPSTALRIGPCGERTLRPPRPCVDDDGYKVEQIRVAPLKFCFKTCVAMKFVDDDDDVINMFNFRQQFRTKLLSKEWRDSFVESRRRRTFVRQLKLPFRSMCCGV